MSCGEARWLLPEGECTYGEFNLVDITYNNRDPAVSRVGALRR
jgi:hypothetical protein